MSQSKELSGQDYSEVEYSDTEASSIEETENAETVLLKKMYKDAISNSYPSLLQSWLYYQLRQCEDINEFEQRALKTIGQWCNLVLAMKYLAVIFSCGIVLLVDYIKQRYQHDEKTLWFGATPFLNVGSVQAELSSPITSVDAHQEESDHEQVLEKIEVKKVQNRDFYFTQDQLYQKITGILSFAKNTRPCVSDLDKKFALDLRPPLKALYAHAVELRGKQKTVAEDKLNAIIFFLDEFWQVSGDTKLEKIQGMRKLVEEQLKPATSKKQPLLINRGLSFYKATSCVASFFGGRCYKIGFKNEQYYVNSSTEHFLVQLYYVLSVYAFIHSPKIGRSGELHGASPQDVNYLCEEYEKETEHLKI